MGNIQTSGLDTPPTDDAAPNTLPIQNPYMQAPAVGYPHYSTNLEGITRPQEGLPVAPLSPYHFDKNYLPSAPEYVFQIDSSRPQRYMQFSYVIGAGYVSGLSVGGTWGLVEGMRNIRKLPGSSSRRIKLNALLNAVTRRGPFLANNTAIICLYFSAFNYLIKKIRSDTEDNYNKLLAAVSAGLIWRATKSSRAAMLAGAAGACFVGSYVLIDQYIVH